MGLFDSLSGGLKGALGQFVAAEGPQLLNAALAQTNLGSLQGIVNQLQQSGMGAQVQSWLGSGQNLPITADQLKAVLSSDQVRQIAQHFGIDPDAALKMLAQNLPTAVDAASPNGELQPPSQ